MQYQKWKDLAELMGMVAIVASLVFVGFQFQQDREIALNEGGLSLLSSEVEVGNALNDHADIWTKANAGIELSDVEAFIFGNLVHSVNIQFFYNYDGALRLLNEETAAIVIHDFAAFLYQNPAARVEWESQESNYVKYRGVLHDGNQYSYWFDSISADLAKLDEMDTK